MDKGQMQGTTTKHSQRYVAEEKRSQLPFVHSTRRAFSNCPCSSFLMPRLGVSQTFGISASIKNTLNMFNASQKLIWGLGSRHG